MQASPEPMTCQVLILGSGCAGSLLAWILSRQGQDVILIDRSRHPRFAIGESSTPLADFLLEQIAERYDLPELKPLARWGSWQKSLPELRCGKKRGFSYYGHRPGQRVTDDDSHHNSLLVAASVDDFVSDTHWMRSDVDQWLCRRAVAAGSRLVEGAQVSAIERETSSWKVTAKTETGSHVWRALWLVDATGNAGLVPQACGAARGDDLLSTRTGSLFGHFTSVAPMTQWLQHAGLATEDDPFDGDDAAQHHVLDDGWVWMLRFACGITSVGFTRPAVCWQREGDVARGKEQVWRDLLGRFPTLADLMAGSELVGPRGGDGEQPNSPQLGWMPRISRLWSAAAGADWLALPSTVGVIDPLHSTGIAHAISGVARAAEILLLPPVALDRHERLERYSREVVDEVRWIDQLVATCYAGLPDFELFTAACTFYFLAAIDCERELSATGRLEHGFLGAQRGPWRTLVQQTQQQLSSGQPAESAASRRRFLDQLRRHIEPWNQAGLLDPGRRNRYIRSAAPK